MKRFMVFLATMVLLTISCGATPPVPNMADLKPPTVTVCAADPVTKTIVRCGQGFAVSDAPYVFTANHVVSPLLKIVLVGSGAIRVLNTPMVVADHNIDMAIIMDDIGEDSALPLCRPIFGDFEDVVIWAKNGPIHGRATGLDRSDIWLFPPVAKGDSGSAIVSVDRKCVIGLVKQVFYYRSSDGSHENHHTMGVSSNALIWLLGTAEGAKAARQQQENQDAGPDSSEQDAGE